MSWTESNAAHKLIRSKNRKASRIARKSSIKSKAQKDAEGMEMTPDIMDYPGLPVVPDSYGTNSALESGQGVPQWYGSAESFEGIRTASDLVEFAESNGGSLDIEIADTMADSEYISFVKPDAEAMDFVFLDGTMATCNKDDDVLNTFVVAYEGETFEAMAFHNPSGDDRDDAKAQFKMTYPGFTMSNSSLQYLVYQSGGSNKYHMFWLAQDKSGGWYAFSGYSRIGYAARMVRINGPTSQQDAMKAMRSKINKKVSEGYTNVSRDFGMNAEESGKFMTFGEISYQYEYEDPSEGNLDEYDVQQIDRAVKNYISDDGGRDGEGVFTYTIPNGEWDIDMDISVSWTHKYSGINSAEEVQAGLPVIPDSYGTNSALSSGQGVPQWYGSAEHFEAEGAFTRDELISMVDSIRDMVDDLDKDDMESEDMDDIYQELMDLEQQLEDITNYHGVVSRFASDEDWDRTEYEYKEVELAKPFRTAFMASLGFVVAPLVLIAGLAFALGDE